jgi:hypothetical protein
MNLLRSVEALLYELVAWLLFYPLTLWRCIVRPIPMSIYAERELTDPPEEQFADALSPPLFLFITIVIAHFLQSAFGSSDVQLPGILGDDRMLLLFRAVTFSLFPLLVGIQRVRQKGQRLNRTTLKPAFYAQCYLVAPFVLAFDLALIVGQSKMASAAPVAWFIFAAGVLWYLVCLTEWFVVHAKVRRAMALVRASGTILAAAIIFLAVVIAVGLSSYGKAIMAESAQVLQPN